MNKISKNKKYVSNVATLSENYIIKAQEGSTFDIWKTILEYPLVPSPAVLPQPQFPPANKDI